MNDPRCQHIKSDGNRCAQVGYLDAVGLCLFHSQQEDFVQRRAEMQKKASAAAVKARKLKTESATLPPLERIEDGVAALAWIAVQVSAGKLHATDASVCTTAVLNWSRLQGYAEQIRDLTRQYKQLLKKVRDESR